MSRETTEVSAAWKFECEDEIRGTPAYYGGSIYVGSYDNNLYSLNAASGEFIWKFATEEALSAVQLHLRAISISAPKTSDYIALTCAQGRSYGRTIRTEPSAHPHILQKAMFLSALMMLFCMP